MMEILRKRGALIAERELARGRSAAMAVLAEEVPADVRIAESAEGIKIAGWRLRQRLIDSGSLRDIGFLIRGGR